MAAAGFPTPVELAPPPAPPPPAPPPLLLLLLLVLVAPSFPEQAAMGRDKTAKSASGAARPTEAIGRGTRARFTS
jgi:hypothetical protein